MKSLSDYTGEDALELWADIFDPAMAILNDEEVRKYTSGGNVSIMSACKVILKNHKDDAFFILNRLDDSSPVNGANAFPRVISLLAELIAGDAAKSFFRSSEPEKSDEELSGSVMENTEERES